MKPLAHDCNDHKNLCSQCYEEVTWRNGDIENWKMQTDAWCRNCGDVPVKEPACAVCYQSENAMPIKNNDGA
jgi:hypothetical protein